MALAIEPSKRSVRSRETSVGVDGKSRLVREVDDTSLGSGMIVVVTFQALRPQHAEPCNVACKRTAIRAFSRANTNCIVAAGTEQ
jgi:hypothetical protein